MIFSFLLLSLKVVSVLVLCYLIVSRKNKRSILPPERKPKVIASSSVGVKIFFASNSGHSEKYAILMHESLCRFFAKHPSAKRKFALCGPKSLEYYDPDDLYTEDSVLFLFVPTYTDGQPPLAAKWFSAFLEDAANDFRVDRSSLKRLKFGVFGLGDSAFAPEHFNTAGRCIDKNLSLLGATRIISFGNGDQQIDRLSVLGDWINRAQLLLSCYSENPEWISIPMEDFSQALPYESDEDISSEPVIDMEDLEILDSQEKTMQEDSNGRYFSGVAIQSKRKSRLANVVPALEEEDDPSFSKFILEPSPSEVPMVTPEIGRSLTKQRYKVVVSHSGVKLCRWTKAMLRGRGGCYKHTFYGIESHRCMEATPSLACANKCVFCWRHHTNPVGTRWVWKLDSAESIVSGALAGHASMVKQMMGVPGASPERLLEAQVVKHCALSLVGEPIIYPHINELVALLHEKSISTFLVTNAQFPDRIAQLSPITQLYVSVDASTKASLKKIDRPLFSDFWERFLCSLKALKEKVWCLVFMC